MGKKKKNIKPRSESIYATTKGKVTEISLSFDSQSGKIEFDTEMISIYAKTTYDRPKGEKVLSRVPQGDSAHFDIDDTIENNYDIVFAIDTNTWQIKGYSVSVSGVIQCHKVFAVDHIGGTRKAWQYCTPFCMEFIEIRAKPENLGWMMLIEHLNSKFKNIAEKRIGIIVDSDLDNLNDYNLRILPIYEQFILPENIKLIYASSDGGAEFFPNKMLKLADKASKLCLRELELGNIPFNNERVMEAPYLAYRRLIPKK